MKRDFDQLPMQHMRDILLNYARLWETLREKKAG